MMKHIPALVFRRRFGAVLDEVSRSGNPVTITRANAPLVVLVPADQYLASGAPAAVRETRLRRAADRVADWKAQHARQLKDADPVALVRRGRAGR